MLKCTPSRYGEKLTTVIYKWYRKIELRLTDDLIAGAEKAA